LKIEFDREGVDTAEESDDAEASEEDFDDPDLYESESTSTLLRKQRIDLAKFKVMLAGKKLRLANVRGDGNCFFRAIADQLYGSEFRHNKLRKDVVDHLKANKEEYRLFMENDIKIDKYIRLMSRDGQWGGQLEMSILAKIHKFNIIMYQVDYDDNAQEFHPWNTKGLKTVHVTYHRGRHYNSVRSVNDPGTGPAVNFLIQHPLMKK